MLWRQLL